MTDQPTRPDRPNSAFDQKSNAPASSESEFRRLFDDNPQPMWIYDVNTLQFLAVNDSAIRHYGYSRSEFLEMTIADIRPSSELQRLRQEDFPTGYYKSAGSWIHRKEDGSLIEVEITAQPTVHEGRPAKFVLAHDVTSANSAERNLRESEERFRMVFSDSALGMALLTRIDLRIFEMNAAFARLFGTDVSTLRGKSLAELSVVAETAKIGARLDSLIAGDTTSFVMELQFGRSDQSRFWGHLAISALHDQTGRVAQFLAVVEDISERKRLEEQLAQAQKMEAIGRLAGGIAHDFNNLLTVIVGQASLLAGEIPSLAQESRDRLDEIQRAAERAAALTSQLLTFSWKAIRNVRELELNQITRDVTRLLRRVIGEDINLSLVEGPPCVIHADAGQIQQLIMNLALFSRDAMRRGGNLRIEVSCVEVTQQDEAKGLKPGRWACLAVSDTSDGMDAETQAHLFEPYAAKGSGTVSGLVLPAVDAIVQQSSGTLFVESVPGRGNRFEIYLPREARPEPEESAGQMSIPVKPPVHRILVAEDESSVRRLLGETLRNAGYLVIEAANSDQALAAALNSAIAIDLVVSDVVMPGDSGPEMMRRLREHKPGLRVLYVSGYTRGNDLLSDLKAGYLQKPFSPAALLAAVEEQIRFRDEEEK